MSLSIYLKLLLKLVVVAAERHAAVQETFSVLLVPTPVLELLPGVLET